MLLIATFVELRVVAGRSRTRTGRPHAVCGRPMLIPHMPCRAQAALCRGLDKSLSERHGRGMAYVNRIGNTSSKSVAARYGRGMAWTRHGNGMVCVN
jgi:hypothetical protein